MIAVLMGLLGNYFARGSFIGVETIARSLLLCVPNDRVSLQFLGLAYYRTGRVEQAVRVFHKVADRRKHSTVRRRHWRAEPAGDSRQGVSASAICYAEATRTNADLARAWFDLGLVFDELAECGMAISAFRAALLALPAYPEAMLAMGASALRAGDLDAASDAFCLLRAQSPQEAMAYAGLAQVYRRRGQFRTARACFARVRRLRESASLPGGREPGQCA